MKNKTKYKYVDTLILTNKKFNKTKERVIINMIDWINTILLSRDVYRTLPNN